MWITPKQLHTSAYVQDTKALGLDSEEFSQISERSLTWRGKDSLSRTWLQRWKRNSWIQHLSTLTLRPSHTESFVDAWTSSVGDSHVNHSPLLDSVKQLMTQDTCSHSSQMESRSANLELFSSKTYKESSPAQQVTENQFSNMSSEHWKKWVTEQRQEYSQRKKLALLTKENESSSWGTPNTMDCLPSRSYEAMKRQATNGQRKNRQRPGNLREQVDPLMCQAYKDAQKDANQKNWATPQVTDTRTDVRMPSERSAKAKKGGCKNLREEVMQPQNWPTATTRDWKDTNATVPPSRANPSKQTLGQRVAHIGLQDQANSNTNGKSQESQQWPTPRVGGQDESQETLQARGRSGSLPAKAAPNPSSAKLNPNWVEQLMGLPVGWTQLPTEWTD